MQTVGAMWELGSCFGKCNRKVCSQTLYFHEVAECMANFPLKRAGVFVSGSLKVDGIQVSVGSSLLDMYANSGCIEDACKVFNKMPSQHVVTWIAMILGCVKCSQGQKALELF